jgi:hypothetical protein
MSPRKSMSQRDEEMAKARFADQAGRYTTLDAKTMTPRQLERYGLPADWKPSPRKPKTPAEKREGQRAAQRAYRQRRQAA